MCGIFGYAGTDEIPGLLEQQAEYSFHRGPDDVGYYVNHSQQIQFGLRRLSIIDLEGGHQPIPNEDETVWIACNGEIFNYLEIREELLAKGHQFRTNSDVEVLVHLYEEYGLDFLDSVNGMFGFVLFDQAKGRLILARDRLGIKPLYYAWDGQRLAFASEIKPILQCPWISRDPDWSAISKYLHLLYVPSPKTGFEGIEKLDAGAIGVFENSSLRLQSYWQPESFLQDGSNGALSLPQASEHLEFLLKDACRLQMRSDVPVAAFLSGGMDSSVVVALSNTTPSLSMNTYTAFWENAPDKMDERLFAKSVATRYGCTYREIALSFDSFDRYLPLLAWHLEEPNADGAFVPTFLISQLAHEYGKVVLTGGGGDELFAGYRWYQSNLPIARRATRMMKWGWWQTGRSVYTSRAFSFPWNVVIRGYEPRVASEFMKGYSRISSADELNRQMTYDLKTWLKDDILLLTDKVTMAASIEARVPLLDHRVVEFVLGLPSTYKLAESESKLILKQAVADYLPKDILQRRKDGFGAPIGSWMAGQFKTLCLDVLRHGELVRRGIIDKRSLERVSHLSSIRKAWGWGLWVLLNLELWFRFVVEPCSRPDGMRLSDLR